ncbi:unnamed protein product [Linum tenue]|uniref:WRKY domain-containing protein n=1 Tax=Linum tenue TaxID=586396 RepID=A0AAV0JY31_9ROSI|nr:unnamed protein product [Linum tenue]
MGEFAFMADWDLDAVVRGGSSCSHIINAPAAADQIQPSSFNFDFDSFHDEPFLFASSSSMEQVIIDDDYTDLDGLLEGLYQPFCNQPLSILTTTNAAAMVAPPPPASAAAAICRPEQPSAKLPTVVSDLSSASSSSPTAAQSSSAAKLRKRRNQQKRVVQQVREEGISSDKWAWRKYGQKPIKGSPYPRSYYRCSSLKGCPARKQVERSTADPSIFIITYTSEHSHAHPTRRNSLAGSTRVKNSITVVANGEGASATAAVKGDEHYSPSVAEDELMMVKEEDEGGVLFQDVYQSSSNDEFVGSGDLSFSDALYPGGEGLDVDGMFLNPW